MTAEKNSDLQIKKVLVAGWFSFSQGHATGGDILALDVACNWLREAGVTNYDVAYDTPFTGGVNWRTVNPSDYTHAIFVCGPFEKKTYEAQFLTRFASCHLIGLNLSMIPSMQTWKPFDLLYERNSSDDVRPDMVFLSTRPLVPVIGVCLVEDYDGALVKDANAAIHRLVDKIDASIVYIDTRLDYNGTNLRSPQEIESLIARVDALVTTRLHGAVMAIKNGVPVVPIDPEAGGAKIVDQMNKIGWPLVFTADALDDDALMKAFKYCLTDEAKTKAKSCRSGAIETLLKTKEAFIHEMNSHSEMEENYRSRLAENKTPQWMTNALADAQKPVANKRKFRSTARKIGLMLLPGAAVYLFKKMRQR